MEKFNNICKQTLEEKAPQFKRDEELINGLKNLTTDIDSRIGELGSKIDFTQRKEVARIGKAIQRNMEKLIDMAGRINKNSY